MEITSTLLSVVGKAVASKEKGGDHPPLKESSFSQSGPTNNLFRVYIYISIYIYIYIYM